METAPIGSGLPEDSYPAVAEPLPPIPPLPPEDCVKYASFLKRFLAYALDNLLIAAVTGVMMATSTAVTGIQIGEIDEALVLAWLVYGLNSAIFVGYFTLTTGRSGVTAGKYLMGIKVERDGGGDIGYSRAFVRSVGYFISGLFLYIGFLFALFSKKSQTFHDLIAGTVVLEKN